MPARAPECPQRFATPAAWQAAQLRTDSTWMPALDGADNAELHGALAHFKALLRERGETAQWLHGQRTPRREEFPLPRLAARLAQVQRGLEHGFGVALLRGIALDGLGARDRQLLHAGLVAHLGRLRPQTVFGELIQDIRDVGQAPLEERRGSKHNRPLGFHNDPCDAISFLCVQPAARGGTGRLASAMAVHDALVGAAPELAAALYRPMAHSYQDYLYVRTAWNRRFIPRRRHYSMPVFSQAQGHFACKYSRYYIDQAQTLPDAPRLTPLQRQALDAFEEELGATRWRYEFDYQPGDLLLVNNYVCFHARSEFADDPGAAGRRRHLLRIWLALPNSRPLARCWKNSVFYRRVEAGAVRGGVPIPELPEA